MENDAGDSTIRKGMCNEEEGDENGRKKIRRTDFAQQSTCEQASRGYEANWEIIMPPSGITVVVPDIEYKCEFVHVPMDVPAPYVANFKPTGVVSATTANTLLRHIAGLSVVAHQRSVHARELLIKMKQRQDMLLAERESEILRLKKEVMQNELKMLSKDMAPSMEEKLLPTTLYSDGNDEFQRVSGHFVIDQNLNSGLVGEMGDPDICPTNKELPNKEVDKRIDDFVEHTGFTTDSDIPTETDDCLSGSGSQIDASTDVKADAQSHVQREGELIRKAMDVVIQLGSH